MCARWSWSAAAAVLVSASGLFADDAFHVWVVPPTQRVLRGDTPAKATRADINAARNEWASIQIAVRSAKPARIVSVAMSSLSHPAVAMAPPPMPERTRFYREHQLHITKGTYRNKAFKPGWYADALIPLAATSPLQGEVAPQARVRVEAGQPGAGRDPHPGPLPERERGAKKARFTALPFDLPAGETHAFWVDVYVPRSMPAGAYRRWVWLRTDGGGFRSIPVNLTVWDFALPALATLKTQFGSPAARIREPHRGGASADAMYAQAARMLTEHQFNAAIPPTLLAHKVKADGSFDLTDDQIAGLKAFAAAWHVNAVPIPRPSSRFGDPVKDRARIAAWLRSWDRNLDRAGLGDRLCYTYLIDEPNDAKAYEHTRAWGKAVRESGSRVKVLVTEQTRTQNAAWGTLDGAIDIWVPLFSLFRAGSAAKRQAAGEAIWTYTALCQGKQPTPWWHTDYPLVNYRAPAWIAWRHGMTGLLYWGGMAYWKQATDPWTDPWTYGKTRVGARYEPRGRVYNGEGTLLYPGRDCGLVGAVPSVRLKALRDAIEDYEYLAILDRLGKRKEALAVVDSVARSWTDWSTDPAAITKARERLAQLIVLSGTR